MSSKDHCGGRVDRDPTQKVVAATSRHCLEIQSPGFGDLSDWPPFNFAPDTVPRRLCTDERLVFVGIGTTKLVVEVGDEDSLWSAPRVTRTAQSVKQRHRIGSTRNPNDHCRSPL